MPNTTNRGYGVPVTGTEVGTWGDVLNDNFDIIDSNLGGVATISLTNTNVTLNAAQYQCGTIRLSGALSGNVVITFPAVQAWWTIDNQTTGAFVATLWIGSGQVIAVEQGAIADILSDGANMKFRNLPAVGTYLDVCDATVPAWITACTVPPFLNCDGTTFSAVTYPYLNTKLGGNTLPDLRGGSRATLNQGTSRITTAGSGIDGNTRFSRGGSETVQLTGNQNGTHNHGGSTGSTSPALSLAKQGTDAAYSGSGATYIMQSTTANALTNVVGTVASHPHTIANDGLGAAHQNMGPTTISGITLIRAA